MSILRTIAMFVYLFGYMIVHYGVLRRAERASAAGDIDTVEQIVNKHIPHWSQGILKVTGVSPGRWKGWRTSRKTAPASSWRTTAAISTSRCFWRRWMSPTASLPRKSWKRFPCSTAG